MNLESKIICRSHDAIPVWKEHAFKKLINQCECKVVDGDEDGFRNNNETLVVAITDCGDRRNPDNGDIHDWIDGYTDLLMETIFELKPDEFEIKSLKGLPGYNRIIRMWWD